MMPVLAPRAASILYGLARGQIDAGVDSRWLLPANICPVVPFALLAARASFDFVDIHPKTYCLDTEAAVLRLRAVRAPPVTAVLYVRTYGVDSPACEDLRVLRAALSRNTLLVDDRCCGVPITDEGQLGPMQADVALFSTGRGKIADLGGGGFAFFQGIEHYHPFTGPARPAVLHRMVRFYDELVKTGGTVSESASEENREELAFADSRWLGGDAPDDWPAYRRAIAARLAEVLPHKMALNEIYRMDLPFLDQLDDEAQFWRFNVETENRDAILAALFAAGLFASAHYFPTAKVFRPSRYPVAERLGRRVLNLFNGPEFNQAQAKGITAILRACFRKGKKVSRLPGGRKVGCEK